MDVDLEISNLIYEFEQPIKKWRDSKILVTGCSGHLGFYFSNFLLQSSEILNLNLELTFTSKGNMRPYFPGIKSNYIHVSGDITGHEFLNKFETFDCILHLAGYAQPSMFIADPLSTIKINSEIVIELLKKLNPSGSFLFLSSSEVYTDSQTDLNSESINTNVITNHSRAPYILSKLLGESICFAELRNSNKNIKVARLSMVYGPGIKKDDQRVVSQFLNQAIKFNNIKLIDQGKAQREYLYITDTLRALLNIIFFGQHALYNIGAGASNSISILEVAEIIAKLTNSSIELSHNNTNKLGARDKVGLDVSRYESEFGKLMIVPFEEGIFRTLNWTKNDWSL
jgi:dTDP-glucose 4,6-dehydratase/UDP-glucuronate decarboxylase